MEALLNKFNLVSLNDGQPTRVQLNINTQSCFDLMIMSGELAVKSEWQVLDSNNMGSDHFQTLDLFRQKFKTEAAGLVGKFNILKLIGKHLEVYVIFLIRS